MSSILNEIFDRSIDFRSEPKHPNHGKKIEVIDFPCVHKRDQEPVNLILPHLKEGPWIAGGAALRWYQDQPVGENDIDIFCKDARQAQNVINYIKSYGRFSIKFESENATTLSYYSGADTEYRQWTLQIITRRYFGSLQEVIDNFDISVCQIGTAGNDWLMGRHTAKDIRERNLRMQMPLQPDAAKRLVKYWTYGYRPVDGLLDSVQNNPNANQMFEIDGDYNNAF
jgi:hypothetical protein